MLDPHAEGGDGGYFTALPPSQARLLKKSEDADDEKSPTALPRSSERQIVVEVPANELPTAIKLDAALDVFSQPVGLPLPDWQPAAAPPGTVLYGRSCDLEPLDVSRHGKALFDAFSFASDAMWTYLPYGPFQTLDEYQAYMTHHWLGPGTSFYAVVRRGRHAGAQGGQEGGREGGQEGGYAAQQGQAVGLCACLRVDPDAGSLEIGHISFSPLLEGTTAATEALTMLIEQAFELGALQSTMHSALNTQ